jgi:hypothetical protein
MVVDLMEHFDMEGAEHLHIRYQLDHGRGGSGCSHYHTLSHFKQRVPRGKALKGWDYHAGSNRKIDGAWTLCGFAFAPLTIGNGSSCYSSIRTLHLWLTTD